MIDLKTGSMPTPTIRTVSHNPELSLLGRLRVTNGRSGSVGQMLRDESRRVAEQDHCGTNLSKQAAESLCDAR
jgi:hypothetical protein